jgi:hypothetical protein
MEDVLDLYEEAYDPCYPTICSDETPLPVASFRGYSGRFSTDLH